MNDALPPPGGPMSVMLVLVPLMLSAVVYHPLTRNYFFADDFLNLYRIANESVPQYLVTPHGGHVLLLRNTFFYLFAQAFDTDPAAYFWVVLATHLVNVCLLFFVIRRFTGSALLACFGATLWGTAPVHDGALGWYSVYGHVLAATVMLVILALLGRAADPDGFATPWTRRACYGLALVAVMLFGVGIGIGLAVPIAAALLVPAWRGPRRRSLPLWTLLATVPLVYWGLFWVNGLFAAEGVDAPAKLTAYALRNVDTMALFLVRLIGFGTTRLMLGFWYRAQWYGPAAAYAAAGSLIALGSVAAARLTARDRRALGACALMTLGCYGMIALGRVLLFQAWGSLVESQPRYHYAALAPLTIVLCFVLRGVAPRRLSLGAKWLLLVSWLASLAGSYWHFGIAIDHHDEARQQTAQVLEAVDANVAAAPAGGAVYIANRPFQQIPLIIPMTDFPGWAAVFVIFHPEPVVRGRSVHFVEKSADVIAAAARGRRTNGLLVPDALGSGQSAVGSPLSASPPN